MSVTAGVGLMSVAGIVVRESDVELLARISKLSGICLQDFDFKSHAA